MKCLRKKCFNVGTKIITIEFRARGFENNPATAEFIGVAICEAHSRTAKVEDFVDAENWERIDMGFNAMGLEYPDRQLTRLVMKRIKK